MYCQIRGPVYLLYPFFYHSLSSAPQAIPISPAESAPSPLHFIQPMGRSLQCHVHSSGPLQWPQPPDHTLPVLRFKGEESAVFISCCIFSSQLVPSVLSQQSCLAQILSLNSKSHTVAYKFRKGKYFPHFHCNEILHRLQGIRLHRWSEMNVL